MFRFFITFLVGFYPVFARLRYAFVIHCQILIANNSCQAALRVLQALAVKRDIKSFEAEKDVLLMLNKAQRRGVKISWLCNESLRRFLKDQGYGPRKETK